MERSPASPSGCGTAVSVDKSYVRLMEPGEIKLTVTFDADGFGHHAGIHGQCTAPHGPLETSEHLHGAEDLGKG